MDSDGSRLPGINAAYVVGPQTVVVETEEGQEVRITARRDVSTGEYHSEYEWRAAVPARGNVYHVWTKTDSHPTCVSADLDDCLEAAVRAVGVRHL